MDSLRLQMESEGLKDVTYMVINHQGPQAQQLHPMLEQRISQNIALYKQQEDQPDVWLLLNGAKDDFFIYDRCGRLTRQVSLPYSIIGQGHIEGAIKDTYCNRLCGTCTYESAEIPPECQVTTEARPNAAPAVDAEPGQHGHHHHHHHHAHHAHDPSMGHHHGNHETQSKSHHSLGQQAHQGHLHVAPQEAQGAPVMQRP